MKITKSIISSSYEADKNLVKDEESHIKEIESKIKEFLTDSSKDLQGLTYDALRSFYTSVLLRLVELRHSVKEELESANETTNTEWTTFIFPYTELDDSEIYNLEQQVATLQNLINNFDYDGATNIEKVAYNGRRRNIYEINKKLEKLRLLQPTDSSIVSMITTSMTKIDKHQTAISSLESMFSSKA